MANPTLSTCFTLNFSGWPGTLFLTYFSYLGFRPCSTKSGTQHLKCFIVKNNAAVTGMKFLSPSYPEGLARHLDASRQKLTPHCLAAIFDSQLPLPKLSLKMPPKLPLPHNRGHFFLFQNCPRGEGNCAAIERQKLSRGNFCLAASRCLSGPSGYCSLTTIWKSRSWETDRKENPEKCLA